MVNRWLAAAVAMTVGFLALGPGIEDLHAVEDGRASRPATIDDLMGIRNVSDTRISPDGALVAYVVSAPDLEKNLHDSDVWLAAADGSRAWRLTAGPGRDDHPRWSPDGRRLAFLSDRGGRTQIWTIEPERGEAKALTSLPDGAGPFTWSPDGRRLALLLPDGAADPEKKKPEGRPVSIDAGLAPPALHIFLADAIDGSCVQLTRGGFSVEAIGFSPDGKRIAYSARPSSRVPDLFNSDLYVLDIESGRTRTLVVRPGPDTSPQWSPDGTRIAFITTGERLEWIANWSIALVPAEGGAISSPGRGFDEFVTACAWSADGKRLFFQANQGVTTQLFALDAASGAHVQLSSGRRVFGDFSFSRDSATAAFTVTDSAQPADVFVSRLEPFQPMRVAETHPQLKGLALGTTEIVRWKSFDGLEIEGLLLKPVGYEPGRRRPLLTYVHGGPSGKFGCGFSPQIGGSTPIQGESHPLQAMAGAGFAIFMPNPRGSYGYGERFRMANVRDWGHGDFLDIMTGIDALVDRGIADPDALGLMGRSYGGYMTAWAVTQTDRFKAAALGAGMSNLVSFYGQTDIPGYLEYYFGGDPWTAKEEYEKRSPLSFAPRVKTPVLITHGEEDSRVPLPQAREFLRALERAGVPARLVSFPRQGHVILEPRSEREIMALNLAWFLERIPGPMKSGRLAQ